MHFSRAILVFLLAVGSSISLSSRYFAGDILAKLPPTKILPNVHANVAISQSITAPSPKLDPEKLRQLFDRGDIAGAIRHVELGWKRQFEDYYQGTMTSELVEVNRIAKDLAQVYQRAGNRTALVYAIPTAKQLELVTISPSGSIRHRRIGTAPRAKLMQTVKEFRTAVTNEATTKVDYLPKAQVLHQWLIAPIESELKAQKIDTLIFCLGGGLRSLPLAALHDGKQFLVEKYSLAIIPAFNLLDRTPNHLQQARILAMGASKFQQQPALPAVPQELSTILSTRAGESWLDGDFTIDRLKARRTAYPFSIIHLATHAKFLPGSPQQSYIQFWDSRLNLSQLKDLGLRSPAVQLLVLSACQTALGDPQAELGFAGLAVQSGSRAVLASLWSVSDTGTLILMDRFYHQLQTTPIKAAALRKAQIEMLKQPLKPNNSQKPQTTTATNPVTVNVSHPYYWSAFTLVGNPW